MVLVMKLEDVGEGSGVRRGELEDGEYVERERVKVEEVEEGHEKGNKVMTSWWEVECGTEGWMAWWKKKRVVGGKRAPR